MSTRKFHVKQGISEELARVLENQLAMWGIQLEREVLGALSLYVWELASYKKANVIGTQDIDELWLGHVIDSLSCLMYPPLREVSSLVDVGTGGGLPGIPLHLVVGFDRACVLESTAKKAEFIHQVSSSLAVVGLEVANCRAEELGKRLNYRASFEASTVRAVAQLDVISEYCLPLLAPGGTMVAMKGRIDAGELEAGKRALNLLGGELEAVIRVPCAPEIKSKDRHLVIIKKVQPTPDRYPRKPGIPRKRPLGARS